MVDLVQNLLNFTHCYVKFGKIVYWHIPPKGRRPPVENLASFFALYRRVLRAIDINGWTETSKSLICIRSTRRLLNYSRQNELFSSIYCEWLLTFFNKPGHLSVVYYNLTCMTFCSFKEVCFSMIILHFRHM